MKKSSTTLDYLIRKKSLWVVFLIFVTISHYLTRKHERFDNESRCKTVMREINGKFISQTGRSNYVYATFEGMEHGLRFDIRKCIDIPEPFEKDFLVKGDIVYKPAGDTKFYAVRGKDTLIAELYECDN